jgi:hypothetical protein
MTPSDEEMRVQLQALVDELYAVDAPRPTAGVEILEEEALEDAIRRRDPQAIRDLIAVHQDRARKAKIYLPLVIILSLGVVALGIATIWAHEAYR